MVGSNSAIVAPTNTVSDTISVDSVDAAQWRALVALHEDEPDEYWDLVSDLLVPVPRRR
jgi:hypothetical protein